MLSIVSPWVSLFGRSEHLLVPYKKSQPLLMEGGGPGRASTGENSLEKWVDVAHPHSRCLNINGIAFKADLKVENQAEVDVANALEIRHML